MVLMAWIQRKWDVYVHYREKPLWVRHRGDLFKQCKLSQDFRFNAHNPNRRRLLITDYELLSS